MSVIRPKRFVKTVEGEEIEIPKVAFAKERLVIDVIKEVYAKLRDRKELLEASDETLPFVAVSALLEVAPGAAVKVASIALEKSEEWVEENLDSEGIAEVVLPFFVKFLKLMSEKVAPLLSQIGGMRVLPVKAPSTDSSQSAPQSSGGQQTKPSGSTQEKS